MTELIKRDDALNACALREDNPPTEMQLSLRNVISALPAINPAAIREAALREAADVCLKSADNFYDPDEDGAWEARSNANTILALIGETK